MALLFCQNIINSLFMGALKDVSFLYVKKKKRKKDILTDILINKSISNFAWSVTMASSQKQVNTEQFVQLIIYTSETSTTV